MSRALALLRSDVRNIARDPILVLISIVPVLLSLLLRFGLPLLTRKLSQVVDLTPYHPLVFSFFMQLTPYMYGLVIGLMLLDERDEHVLVAIAVTPLTRGGFLVYRLAMPVAFGFLVCFGMLFLSGVVTAPLGRFTLIAALAALQAPINAMLLIAFAKNKVEGMAVAKAGGILLMAPIAIPFLDVPLQYIAGISPVFWVSKAFVTVTAPTAGFSVTLVAGILVNITYLTLLGRQFAKRIE
jgi:fluoroquinolone transport system permease protein